MKTWPGIAFVTMLASASHAQADVLGDAMMLLENQQMQRLAQQQNRPGVVIGAFRSDGCSGGLSEAWTFVAGISPEFARIIGSKPPWEYCCVAHDESYWRGESDNGFEKRQQADADLRACVRRAGEEQSADIAKRLGLLRQDVLDLIYTTADLMYQAVRLGGGPCTGLPWRWGHGWPECAPDVETLIDNRQAI
ncbi:MAG: hypothetical protein OEN02_00930 [Gammaproteobacteria bacterium]|nr:hypothetical protein [Gammaproteobacteria bacterium]